MLYMVECQYFQLSLNKFQFETQVQQWRFSLLFAPLLLEKWDRYFSAGEEQIVN